MWGDGFKRWGAWFNISLWFIHFKELSNSPPSLSLPLLALCGRPAPQSSGPPFHLLFLSAPHAKWEHCYGQFVPFRVPVGSAPALTGCRQTTLPEKPWHQGPEEREEKGRRERRVEDRIGEVMRGAVVCGRMCEGKHAGECYGRRMTEV